MHNSDKMASAFVLINTEVSAEQNVLEALKKIDEVAEVYVVYGIYDIVCKITASNLHELKKVTTEGLRHIKNIRTTMTMIAVDTSQ